MSDVQEPAPPAAPDEEGTPISTEQPNGVLIVRQKNDQGGIATDTVPLGDVEPTEVQTIIELGLAGWRQKLGLK